MKVLYSYISVASEGSKIHIDSFRKSFISLGEEIIDMDIPGKPFTEDKSSWSLFKKLLVKIKWVTLNIFYLWKILLLALRTGPDVLLFRFQQNHVFFLPIVVLSYAYPVVLEINSLRTIEDPNSANRISNLLDRWSLSRAGQCFVVSQVIKDHIIGRSVAVEDKIAVIENGVDVDLFDMSLDSNQMKRFLGFGNRFIAGFVGSIKPWHGVENLISLAESVKLDIPEILFLIVGDGKDRCMYEETVRKKGLEKEVVFVGLVTHEQVQKYLAAMDVAMAPHKSNSFVDSGGFHGSPLKIFEYMAMGKAIIAAPIGQINDVIVDGDSGRLIRSEDIPSLRETLIQLYKDRTFRETLGKNARKRVEQNYTWKVNAEKVRNVCRMAIEWSHG